MRRLYQARDLLEANLLKDRLAHQHISSIIRGEYLTGAAGELPAFNFPEVWVDDGDLIPARRVLEAFLTAPQTGGAWRCPECGELIEGQFELCWKCGASRP